MEKHNRIIRKLHCDEYLFGFILSFILFFTVLFFLAFDGCKSGVSVLMTIHHHPTSQLPSQNYTANTEPAVIIIPDDRRNNVPKNDTTSLPDPCSGRFIYVYNLPSRFNDDLINNCKSLSRWFDMCPTVMNSGLGPRVSDPKRVLSNNISWYATNQFLLDVIFRTRMNQYQCLTNDSSLASAVFIPFYAGLDVGRHLWGFNTSVRDSLALELVEFLRSRPEWRRMSGRDHFLVGGRIAYDYRRWSDKESDWGNKLMFLPESNNMTLLSIESTSYRNEFSIPYPTYFHPSTGIEVAQWQERILNRRRRYLFAFVGAPRSRSEHSIRFELMKQCARAPNRTCKLLECTYGHHKCDDPVEVIKVFSKSVFCLQPPGDSYTRRSTFDSILAGCIPVFFHPGSAYRQYAWHFPENYSKYSMFIPEDDVQRRNVGVFEVLSRAPAEEIKTMREEVVRMIPRIVYADPRGKVADLEDAFDVAVKGVLDRIEGVRRKISQGEDPSFGFSDLDPGRFNFPL